MSFVEEECTTAHSVVDNQQIPTHRYGGFPSPAKDGGASMTLTGTSSGLSW